MNLKLLSLVALPSLLATPFSVSAAGDSRPNFLVLLTDDVGWGDVQCYNPQSKVPSPNIDQLAREGMRFTNAHTPSALCAPTRYTMLTGNYVWRGRDPFGVWGFNCPSSILPEQQTVGNMLQAAGYRTAMLGKSGIGGKHTEVDGKPDFTQPMVDGPKRWGFDYSFIIPRGHQSKPLMFLENELPSCGADQLIGSGGNDYSEPEWDHSEIGERMLQAVERFLDDEAGEDAPFYLYFCSDGAHYPYFPPDELRGTPIKGVTGVNGHLDMVYQTDVLLGKLMEILETRGLLENTVVCYTSDNGGIPEEQHLGHDAVGGLRGMKTYIPEGGHRVPFVVRWPNHIPAGTVRDQVVSTFDIIPTALELANAEIPEGQCLDAVSLVPVLTGKQDDSQPVRSTLLIQSHTANDFDDDGTIKGGPLTGNEKWKSGKILFGHQPREGETMKDVWAREKRLRQGSPSDGMSHAVYDGDWKLLLSIADEPAALYNLKDDLIESHNLIDSYPERVKSMEKMYREIRASEKSSDITSQSRKNR